MFEAAAGGTLFLDEIENLSSDAQKALLTALNDGVVRRVGATAALPHTARIVAASNADLFRKHVADGFFRADLLMRLNPALALELPPLSARREDLEDLADDFAAAFFSDRGHRAEILAQVRAAGAPEPDREDAFELARGEQELARSRSPGRLFAAAQGLGRDREAPVARKPEAVRHGPLGPARGDALRARRGVARPRGARRLRGREPAPVRPPGRGAPGGDRRRGRGRS